MAKNNTRQHNTTWYMLCNRYVVSSMKAKLYTVEIENSWAFLFHLVSMCLCLSLQEINDFIDSGKKGTVLMSLGTNMKSSMLEEKVLIEILRAFEQIPAYNFLWKFETDVLPIALPKNVKTSAFLPQNDILAHKNIKAFITHGGECVNAN